MATEATIYADDDARAGTGRDQPIDPLIERARAVLDRTSKIMSYVREALAEFQVEVEDYRSSSDPAVAAERRRHHETMVAIFRRTLTEAVAAAEAEFREAAAAADRAVVVHLVRLIQDSPDVRYYVGGAGTQMRQLLLAAITAAGFQGDPATALAPPPHRRDDLTERERLSRRIDELEDPNRAVDRG